MAAESSEAGETRSPMLTAGPSLGDQAYRVLRRMITDGELEWGQRITERALGERLGVSATPVREAFRRLEHERLIERVDRRTVSVVSPSDEDLARLNLIQAALRGVAARLAAESATDEELAEIRRAHEETLADRDVKTPATPAERVSRTRRLHAVIDRAAHSDVLLDMIATATAFDLSERVQAAETLRKRYPLQGYEEHGDIVAAILQRDGDKAERLMRAHITRTSDFFTELRRLATENGT